MFCFKEEEESKRKHTYFGHFFVLFIIDDNYQSDGENLLFIYINLKFFLFLFLAFGYFQHIIILVFVSHSLFYYYTKYTTTNTFQILLMANIFSL